MTFSSLSSLLLMLMLVVVVEKKTMMLLIAVANVVDVRHRRNVGCCACTAQA